MFSNYLFPRESTNEIPQKLISLGAGNWCEPRDINAIEAAKEDKGYAGMATCPPRVIVRRRGGHSTVIAAASLDEARVLAGKIAQDRDEALFGGPGPLVTAKEPLLKEEDLPGVIE